MAAMLGEEFVDVFFFGEESDDLVRAPIHEGDLRAAHRQCDVAAPEEYGDEPGDVVLDEAVRGFGKSIPQGCHRGLGMHEGVALDIGADIRERTFVRRAARAFRLLFSP